MNGPVADKNLIAYCGLYCGACRQYVKGKCPGCAKNDAAGWCKVRQCCREKKFSSCADCRVYADVANCVRFNNFMSRLFGWLFNSNRKACIGLIREKGYDEFAKYMAGRGRQSMPRKG